MGIKVTFDPRTGRISVEGESKDLIAVLEAAKGVAPHFKHMSIGPASAAGEVEEPTNSGLGGGGSTSRKPAMRDFGRSLVLNNTYERIAALAYYAIKTEGRTSFSPKEMDDWFGLCGFKKPGNMRVALADAKAKYGYVTSKGYAQWTIATGGENLVMEKNEEK